VLDAYLFNDLSEVRKLAWEWMDNYNETYPHKSLVEIINIRYSKNKKRLSKKKQMEVLAD